MNTKHIETDVKMTAAFRDLLREGCGNAEEWQKVIRLRPAGAPLALALAVQQAGADTAVTAILNLAQTPAMRFAALGDGTGYDEAMQIAAFATPESANQFRRDFPDWTAVVESGHYGSGNSRNRVQ